MKQTSVPITMLAAVLATACTPLTVRGLRKEQPTIVTTTARTVTEITGCLAPIWEKVGGEPSFVPKVNGGTLTFGGYPSPLMTMDIVDDGTARQITLFGPYTALAAANRHRLEEVRSCL